MLKNSKKFISITKTNKFRLILYFAFLLNLFAVFFSLFSIYSSQSLIGVVNAISILILLLIWYNIQNGDFSSKNTKFWMRFFLLLLVGSNFILFYVYQLSHQGDIWKQIWDYLSSDVFKVVSVSIIIPVITFLVENIFKIRERNEERIYQQQLESIIKTQDNFWKSFIDFSNKVILFKTVSNEENMDDILYQLNQLTISGNHVVVSWGIYFSDYIKRKDVELMIDLLNYLLLSTLSVAYYIKENGDYQKLQRSLWIIVNELVYDIHPNIDLILNSSMTFDFKEPKQQKMIKTFILNKIAGLRLLFEDIRRLENEYNEIFPYVQKEDFYIRLRLEYMRKIAKEIITSADNGIPKNKSKILNNIERLKVVCNNQPCECRVNTDIIPFSSEFIMSLADYLSCNHYLVHDLERRSPNLRKILD